MRTAIIYHSAGGNTKALAEAIHSHLPDAGLFSVKDFNQENLKDYECLLIGTYTWGDGELPARMVPFYEELEQAGLSETVTGVFGTGETNYRSFCGAVDRLRDMLYAKSRLAAVLKVEQMYQSSDQERIKKFAHICSKKRK